MQSAPARSFLTDLLGKIGAPVFAATLVGCILQEELSLSHGILLVLGLALLAFGHWQDQHGR